MNPQSKANHYKLIFHNDIPACIRLANKMIETVLLPGQKEYYKQVKIILENESI